MKKSILKFANRLLSKDQMRSIKGGTQTYCNCNGSPLYVNLPNGWDCGKYCRCYFYFWTPDCSY
jgi:hypothetical protein